MVSLSADELDKIRAEIEAEYKKDLAALDRVASIVARKGVVTVKPPVAVSEPPTLSAETRAVETRASTTPPPTGGRTKGLRKAARDVLQYMPASFTRFDLIKGLEEYYPEIAASMSGASIRGVFEGLVKEGLADLVEQGVGKKPSIYRKAVVEQNSMSNEA